MWYSTGGTTDLSTAQGRTAERGTAQGNKAQGVQQRGVRQRGVQQSGVQHRGVQQSGVMLPCVFIDLNIHDFPPEQCIVVPVSMIMMEQCSVYHLQCVVSSL